MLIPPIGVLCDCAVGDDGIASAMRSLSRSISTSGLLMITRFKTSLASLESPLGEDVPVVGIACLLWTAEAEFVGLGSRLPLGLCGRVVSAGVCCVLRLDRAAALAAATASLFPPRSATFVCAMPLLLCLSPRSC
jgi:hypothetical protein